MIYWDEFKPLFSLFISRGLSFRSALFGCHENSYPRKQLKKKRFNLSRSYHLKWFMVTKCSIGGNSRKDRDIYRFRFIAVASRRYKADLNLNNIIATPQCPQTWSQLRSMNAKAGEHQRSELCGLDFTISVRCKPIDLFSTTSLESQESYLTSGMLPYNRNVTLQTFLSITRDFYRLHSTFVRLYNAAASPASRLRSAGSAGSLAIILRNGTDLC